MEFSINSIFKLVVRSCSEIQVFVQPYSAWLPWLMKLPFSKQKLRALRWIRLPRTASSQLYSKFLPERIYGCFFNCFQLETSMNQAGKIVTCCDQFIANSMYNGSHYSSLKQALACLHVWVWERGATALSSNVQDSSKHYRGEKVPDLQTHSQQ